VYCALGDSLNLRLIVTDPDQAAVAGRGVEPTADQSFDALGGLLVQSRSGLIQKENGRLQLDAADEGGDLRLATGKVSGRFCEKFRTQMDSLEQGMNDVRAKLPPVVDAELEGQPNVGLDGPLHESRALMEVEDLSAEAGHSVVVDRLTRPEDLPGVERVQAGERP